MPASVIEGCGEVVSLATALVVAYVSLTALIVASGVWYLLAHPALLTHWLEAISSGDYHLAHAPLSGKGPLVAIGIAC